MKQYLLPLILVFALLTGCAATKAPINTAVPTTGSAPEGSKLYASSSSIKDIIRLEKKIDNVRDTMTLSFAAMDEYYVYRNTQLFAKLDMYEAETYQNRQQVDTLVSALYKTNDYLQKLNEMPVFFGKPELKPDIVYETPEEVVTAVMQDVPKKQPEMIAKPRQMIPEIQVPILMNVDWYIVKFKEALNLFYMQKYSSSLEIFELLYSREPTHPYTGKTIYWTAECYYALRQYRKAYNTFEDVFATEEFEKFDDSQLKLGFCYFKMGKMKLAVQEFKNLLTYYPNSELTDIATRQVGIITYYIK